MKSYGKAIANYRGRQTVCSWLLVCCVYLVPLGVIPWLVRWWWRARAKATTNATP